MPVLRRIERRCAEDLDHRGLRVAVLDELRRAVPFSAHAFVVTDPETSVGSSPLAEIPVLDDLPALIRLKYATPVNRWTTLSAAAPAGLVAATGGDLRRSPLGTALRSRYGVTDVASAVLRDRWGCWGFLDLWRRDGPFTTAELDLLGDVSRLVTPALRRSLAATFTGDGGTGSAGGGTEAAGEAHGGAGGPVVLLLDDDLVPLTQSASVDASLRRLLPTDPARSPVPAGALNVAAQLLAVEAGVDANPPWARVHAGGGVWLTLRAARVGPAGGGAVSIAVTIEATPPAARTDLYARAIGLSLREGELLRHLVAGLDTRQLAQRLFVSEHTVQDHLKSISTKAGTHNRRVLVARATGALPEAQ